MKTLLLTLVLVSAGCLMNASEAFRIYPPSRSEDRILVVSAIPEGDSLRLQTEEPIDVGFSVATIVAHPEKELLYVTPNRASGEKTLGAVVALDEDGKSGALTNFPLSNGYSYISLDRTNRFLLGCDYGGGFVDVYALDDGGIPGDRVAYLNEGRKNAHCVLLSPDNRFFYIPYVKDNNALFQYRFDEEEGKITPLEPLNADPPEGTGPRHLAYHPTQPFLYTSNEQHLGVSVYQRAESGQLSLVQVCDITGPEVPEGGSSSSDILITPDGKYLFAGIRSSREEFNFISRYVVGEDGKVEHLGMTPADKIPWGLALSPDGSFLLATGFQDGTLMAFRIDAEGGLSRVASLDWDKSISDLVTR